MKQPNLGSRTVKDETAHLIIYDDYMHCGAYGAHAYGMRCMLQWYAVVLVNST